jgi:hypothetical protein
MSEICGSMFRDRRCGGYKNYHVYLYRTQKRVFQRKVRNFQDESISTTVRFGKRRLAQMRTVIHTVDEPRLIKYVTQPKSHTTIGGRIIRQKR